jgi:uncharacterized protein YcfJ
MKKLTVAICSLMAGTLASVAPFASAATSYDEAKVLSSTPIYHTVEIRTPERQCHEEEVERQVRRPHDDSATPEILGAVVGGAIGNAVGHHTINSKVGTVVGAVLGGSIAHDIEQSNRDDRADVVVEKVERCKTVSTTHQEEKLVGYDVRYSYNGSERTVRLDHDPGATVKVRVNVEPVL